MWAVSKNVVAMVSAVTQVSLASYFDIFHFIIDSRVLLLRLTLLHSCFLYQDGMQGLLATYLGCVDEKRGASMF